MPRSFPHPFFPINNTHCFTHSAFNHGWLCIPSCCSLAASVGSTTVHSQSLQLASISWVYDCAFPVAAACQHQLGLWLCIPSCCNLAASVQTTTMHSQLLQPASISWVYDCAFPVTAACQHQLGLPLCIIPGCCSLPASVWTTTKHSQLLLHACGTACQHYFGLLLHWLPCINSWTHSCIVWNSPNTKVSSAVCTDMLTFTLTSSSCMTCTSVWLCKVPLQRYHDRIILICTFLIITLINDSNNSTVHVSLCVGSDAHLLSSVTHMSQVWHQLALVQVLSLPGHHLLSTRRYCRLCSTSVCRCCYSVLCVTSKLFLLHSVLVLKLCHQLHAYSLQHSLVSITEVVETQCNSTDGYAVVFLFWR